MTCGKKQGLLGTVERQFLNALIWTKNVPFWPQTEVSPAYWNSIINRANSRGHTGSCLWEGRQIELSCNSGDLCGCHKQDSEIVTATWESKSSCDPQPPSPPRLANITTYETTFGTNWTHPARIFYCKIPGVSMGIIIPQHTSPYPSYFKVSFLSLTLFLEERRKNKLFINYKCT